jgi:hypothetical protein
MTEIFCMNTMDTIGQLVLQRIEAGTNCEQNRVAIQYLLKIRHTKSRITTLVPLKSGLGSK